MKNTGIYSQTFKGNEMPDYVFGKVFNPKDSVFMSSFGMAWSDSIYGSVGIVSNTSDLYEWDRALCSNRLVKKKTLDEIFEPFILLNDSSSGYGFGWFIRENYRIREADVGKRADHYGIWPGYESSIVRFPDADRTIIILCNQSPSAKDKLVEDIGEVLFEKDGG